MKENQDVLEVIRTVEKSTSRSMVLHIIPANILFIVNVIFTDGIRVFLNTLNQKNRSNLQNNNFFCRGIINLLFDGLAYNTSRHFAHCSQNIRTYYMLNHRIRCMYLPAEEYSKCSTWTLMRAPLNITLTKSSKMGSISGIWLVMLTVWGKQTNGL